MGTQRPRSFWSAPRIGSSGRLQHRKSTIHGLFVKSGKSDWLKMQNDYSAYAQNIGFGRSRSLVLTRRVAATGDETDSACVAVLATGYPGCALDAISGGSR